MEYKPLPTSKYHAKSTAEEVAAGILGSEDKGLEGKVAIVTGGNGGLGKECVRVLAKHRCHVIIACRNVASGEAAVKEFKEAMPYSEVDVMHLDLNSLESVRKFAKEYEKRGLPIHFLVNNAGIMAVKDREQTKDGFEAQVGTNHLAHFLLTVLLMPILKKSAPARFISVSSIGHMRNGLDFDDMMFDKREYNKWTAYAQSKTCNILLALEVNKRLAKDGVLALSLHPGGIMTGLQEHMDPEEFKIMGWIDKEGKLNAAFKTIEQGTSTHLYAILEPSLVDYGGAYLEDANVSVTKTDISKDPEAAKKLWDMSEALVNVKANF
ncbi:hypothetical protein SmJEL517_g02420 [Synchytrium microbalum]|uniref:Uncharacterized protein n=1 Tax=Synchytrium microbalum TaxID=1806994 RepID=A0A507C698_9FUNG|nr:uncharacterized protein SmJEL517_g02420 [Synchytrium microbalum]TPX35031.1 hypothetical protein SmJEL517_g02420 [Synchytrium microbalum]